MSLLFAKEESLLSEANIIVKYLTVIKDGTNVYLIVYLCSIINKFILKLLHKNIKDQLYFNYKSCICNACTLLSICYGFVLFALIAFV